MTANLFAILIALTNPYFATSQCATIDSTINVASWTRGRSVYETTYTPYSGNRAWKYRSQVPLVVKQAEAALKADPAKAKIVTICSTQH